MQKTNETALYLLVHRDHKKFKIGKAVNTKQRIAGLGGFKEFDLSLSHEIIWPTELSAQRTEKALHHYFSADKIEHEDKRAGFTEWFNYRCYEEAIIIAKQFAEKHKLPDNAIKKGIELDIKTKIEAILKPEMTKEERRIIYHEKRRRILREKILNDYENNEKYICLIIEELQKISPWILALNQFERNNYLSWAIKLEYTEKTHDSVGVIMRNSLSFDSNIGSGCYNLLGGACGNGKHLYLSVAEITPEILRAINTTHSNNLLVLLTKLNPLFILKDKKISDNDKSWIENFEEMMKNKENL